MEEHGMSRMRQKVKIYIYGNVRMGIYVNSFRPYKQVTNAANEMSALFMQDTKLFFPLLCKRKLNFDQKNFAAARSRRTAFVSAYSFLFRHIALRFHKEYDTQIFCSV